MIDGTWEKALDFAEKHSDGHFTLLKFTTNWRASFDTPNSYEDISSMCKGATADEAIYKAMTKVVVSLLGNVSEERLAGYSLEELGDMHAKGELN